MDFTINIKRLERIDKLIRRKQTGSPPELAQKINISEATLYRYLRLMKMLGAPVLYDSIRQSYFYERNGTIKIHFCEAMGKKVHAESYYSKDR